MARKRKTTRKTTYKRRRRSSVGAINPTNMLMNIAGLAAGVAGAAALNKMVLGNQNETIQKAAPLAIGLALPLFVKSELGKSLGNGMIAYGVGKVFAGMGLAGLGEEFSVPLSISGDEVALIAGDNDFVMAGYDNSDSVMAGDDNLSLLAGFDDMDY